MSKKIFEVSLAVIIAALLLASCGSETGDAGSDSTKSDTTAVSIADESRAFADLHAVADSVKEFYGDGIEFVFDDDEYSDEVLEYTYGIYEERMTSAIDGFVLTECDGMRADTFALVRFREGTDKSVIEEAAAVMEDTYIESLKSKLSAYNPEEFAASDKYILKTYDNAVLMVISGDNGATIAAKVK